MIIWLCDGVKGTCGASLVGPNLVLTAAPCIINPQSGPNKPSHIQYLFKNSERQLRSARVIDIAYDPEFQFDPVGTITKHQMGSNIALLRLKQVIEGPTKEISSFNRELRFTGLLHEHNGKSTKGEFCKTTFLHSKVAALDCKRRKDTSGSPAFELINGRRTVIGIVFANPLLHLSKLKWLSHRPAKQNNGARSGAFSGAKNQRVQPEEDCARLLACRSIARLYFT